MSKLVDIQTAIVNRLTSTVSGIPAPTPANGSVQWFTEDIGDLANKISLAIGKLGICGTVITPSADVIKEGEGPGIAITALIAVQIQENVLINRGNSGTKIASLALIEFVMKRLHWFEIGSQRIRRVVLAKNPYEFVADTPTLVYNVLFNVNASL